VPVPCLVRPTVPVSGAETVTERAPVSIVAKPPRVRKFGEAPVIVNVPAEPATAIAPALIGSVRVTV